MNLYVPVIKSIQRYIEKNPEENVEHILNLLSKVTVLSEHKEQVATAKKLLLDPNSIWHRYAMRGFSHIDPNIIKNLIVKFFVNCNYRGIPKQREMAAQIGVSVPWAILIDPTEACNLQCRGCWAGDYEPQSLSYEVLDRVLTEAEELGIYFIVMSGGEPTIRRKDIVKLAEKHRNQVFHLFTNGILFDEEFLNDVKRVGNITFAISIDGLRDFTDARRGAGTFDMVMRAMDLCRLNGVPFGFSATYTRQNTEEVGSEEFIDLLIEKGCYFGWYFTYVPVGKDIDLEFMATPEQRSYMYKRVRYIREVKGLPVADFWNDGELADGCIAGGRRYLHINAAGEVEPCAFIHYANVNIKQVSLVEALQSPIMRAYQKRQPFNANMLRPCPLIDNPEKLVEIIEESGAHTTQAHSESSPANLAHELRQVAHNWGETADNLWYLQEGYKVTH